MRERDRGPRSELSRYAYGYSDKKPGWVYWGITLFMIGFVAYHMFSFKTATSCDVTSMTVCDLTGGQR